jgi:hypothetical protein
MQPDRLRKSLLGAIRYGKLCVIDMMEIDLVEQVVAAFEAVVPGLWELWMSKGILKDEAYMCLAKKDDGSDYDVTNFQQAKIESQFRFAFMTSMRIPPESLLPLVWTMCITEDD